MSASDATNDSESRGYDRRAIDLAGELAELPADQRSERLRALSAEDDSLARRVETLLEGQTHEGEVETKRDNDAHPAADAQSDFPPAPTRPKQVGPYHILSLIGEGGMGEVYKAEQRTPVRRVVALKVIKLGMDTRGVIARFEAERQALAMMDHPNVARVFDAGATDGGRPFFAMEFVAGEPITRYCDFHNLSIRDRLELFIDVCEAVQHAHQKGIIHRDIKPTNVLVSVRDGGKPTPKVIDFGVAKATNQRLTEQTLFTEAGQLIGTPEYMSPEQAEMGALDIDTRSDVYSLGVLLYELLTGCLPFDSATLRRAAYVEIRRIIREVEPPRPSTRLSSLDAGIAADVVRRRSTAVETLRVELKRELEWIPLKALRKDRTQRYRTASELADDIRNYLENRPLLAGPESATYRFRKLLRRNKGPVAAAAAILLVLVAGIAGTTIGLVGQSKQRALAEQRRVAAELEKLEAQQQSAIAEATNTFLSEMLATADPGNLLGDKVTVLRAIQAAVTQLDAGSLDEQPLVEAAIRMTIGRTLNGLGQFDAALPNLQKALDIRRRTLPAGHEQIAFTLNNLAFLLQAQGKYTDAERAYREALDLCRKSLPPGHPGISTSLSDLALLFRIQGRFAEADPLFREALELKRKHWPARHPEIAAGLNNLAQLLQDQGKLVDAEPLFREALDIYGETLPAGHPRAAEVANNLALLLHHRGEFKEGEQRSREALQGWTNSLPSNHPHIATALNNLAMQLLDQDRLVEAERMYREALKIRRASLPPGHPDLAHVLGNLALVLQKQGKLSDAEPLYREAVDLARKGLPAGHLEIATSLNNLAQLLHARGQLSEAERIHREALELRRKALPAGHQDIAASLEHLAIMMGDQDRFAEAETFYREALDICKTTFGESGKPTTRNAAELAKLLDGSTRHAEATALRREFKLAPSATEPTTSRAPSTLPEPTTKPVTQ